ncbi:MAG TPA: AraC family transcriptional regulator [Bacteroidia bacterium]|jgi:AraC-like DNA-binding protein|nr:AraC family transcriptional regulator [Bacteroidia bacterium]
MLNQKEITLSGQQLQGTIFHKPQFKLNVAEAAMSLNDSTENFEAALHKVKTELVSKKKNLLIESIKKTIIDLIYYSEQQIKTNFSDYLSEKLGYHYTYLANLFSKVEGCSIQQFTIITKIDRVKELLVYEDMRITEISFKLHYSSVAHLSNQFKKVTGFSPSQYLASIRQNKNILPGKFSSEENTYSDLSKEETKILSLVINKTSKTRDEDPQEKHG